MPDVALVLGTSTFNVAAEALRLNSNLLLDHPGLQTYQVRAHVSSDNFREFLRAIEAGSPLSLTPDNLSELSLLCEEFGAGALKRSCDHFAARALSGSAIDSRFDHTEFKFEDTMSAVIVDVTELKRELSLLKTDCGGFKVGLRDLKDSVGGLHLTQEIAKKH
jgi:hypothetical protein